MKTYSKLVAAPVPALSRVRAQAFAALTPTMAATYHLSLVPKIYPAGHTLVLVDRTLTVPHESIIVFVDEMPGANFGHPCRYRFHSPTDGRLLHEESASFPPEVSDPETERQNFHAPLQHQYIRPQIFKPTDWARVHPWPWFHNDNRFALLFTSQISNRRHVEDLEFGWRILRHRLGFPAGNIYVLCYDGTIRATDATAQEMVNWVGDNTPYQMHVHASATKQNLQDTLTTIGARMNSESLLFIHTNNHGSQTGLCVDNSTVVTPTEWGAMLAGMPAFGTLVVTMEQCYSGAFSNPTLEHSTAARTSFASAVPADKVSAGATHFDPWAQTWFEGINGGTAYGASLASNADTNDNGRVSVREAFDYSDANDTASYDNPQYADKPIGCGKFVYLNKAPTLADIIRELLARLVAIDKHIVKGPPLPDPAPDWAAELMTSLTLVDALSHNLGIKLERTAPAIEEAPTFEKMEL
jgi:hypothetical protein